MPFLLQRCPPSSSSLSGNPGAIFHVTKATVGTSAILLLLWNNVSSRITVCCHLAWAETPADAIRLATGISLRPTRWSFSNVNPRCHLGSVLTTDSAMKMLLDYGYLPPRGCPLLATAPSPGLSWPNFSSGLCPQAAVHHCHLLESKSSLPGCFQAAPLGRTSLFHFHCYVFWGVLCRILLWLQEL